MVEMNERTSGKLETGDAAIFPAVKWEKLFPQVFKRGGEIRTPKGAFKSKAKPKELLNKAKVLRQLWNEGQFENPRLNVIVQGGGLWIDGSALDDFMALEDNGLDDLIFAGWYISLI